MTTQHTLEPWKYDFNQLAVFDDGRTPVCLTEDEYNHARKCVKACDGFGKGNYPIPSLRDCYDKYAALQQQHSECVALNVKQANTIGELMQQRAELLADLRTARKMADLAHSKHEIVAFLDEAIAKVGDKT